ncbi:MAG TPA: anti-sigma factor [Candidatus Acidoferrales bacterium]|nr:anti-sigma factor [Candidatus Acidoferrales bacterium]
MMTHDDELHDQLAALALGVLTNLQAEQVRAHIATCESCKAEFQELRAITDAVAQSAEIPAAEMEPARSARMKSRILASVHSQSDGAAPRPPVSTRSRPLQLAYVVATAAILLAMVSMLRAVNLEDEVNTDNDRLAQLHDRIDDQARSAAEQNERMADLFAADSQHYAVPGGEVVRHGNRIYLAMRSLPKLPAGRVFQAWTLSPGAKVMEPSITFTPNRQGMAIVQLPIDGSKITTIAVSVEPEGGSKAPTTTPTFVEKLS